MSRSSGLQRRAPNPVLSTTWSSTRAQSSTRYEGLVSSPFLARNPFPPRERFMYPNPYEIAKDLSEDGPFTRNQAERLAVLKYWIEVKDAPIDTLEVAEFLSVEGPLAAGKPKELLPSFTGFRPVNLMWVTVAVKRSRANW